MKRHETHPDWLVDDRGHTWRHERVFGCDNHPYGPPRELDDEADFGYEAIVRVVRGLWDELGTAEAIATVTGATIEQINESHKELGLCCAGHRWRNTGRLIEVGSMEQFVYVNMRRLTDVHRDSISRSILLDEINKAGSDPATWQGTDARVVIPLILRGTPLPRSAAAIAADEIVDGPH